MDKCSLTEHVCNERLKYETGRPTIYRLTNRSGGC